MNTSWESAVDVIPGLRFVPWRGASYSQGIFGGRRTLILGESHYGPVTDVPDLRRLTAAVVEAYLSAPASLRLFRRVEELFGITDNIGQRYAFWNSIAFANYIQVLLTDRDHRPTAEDWRNARMPFVHLLSLLEPDMVLVLGTGVWNALSAPGTLTSRPAENLRSDPQGHPTIYQWTTVAGRQTFATWVHHPTGSRGFRVADWRPRVLLLVSAARSSGQS